MSYNPNPSGKNQIFSHGFLYGFQIFIARQKLTNAITKIQG